MKKLTKPSPTSLFDTPPEFKDLDDVMVRIADLDLIAIDALKSRQRQEPNPNIMKRYYEVETELRKALLRLLG